MPRSGRSAEVFGEAGLGDEGGVVWGIKAGSLGDEGEIDAFLFAEGQVIFERLGIILEILGAVKLDGIDENGDGNRSAGSDPASACPNGAISIRSNWRRTASGCTTQR